MFFSLRSAICSGSRSAVLPEGRSVRAASTALRRRLRACVLAHGRALGGAGRACRAAHFALRLGARLRRGQTPRPRRRLHSPYIFGRRFDREGIAQVEACPPAAVVRRGAPFAMRGAREEMSSGAKRRLAKCAFNAHGHRKITYAEQGRRLLDARRHCSEREVQRLRPRPCRRGALGRNARRHRRRPRGWQGRLASRLAPPHRDRALCAAACSYRSARDLRPRPLALRRGRCRSRRRERENLNFSLKATVFCPHLILFAQKA